MGPRSIILALHSGSVFSAVCNNKIYTIKNIFQVEIILMHIMCSEIAWLQVNPILSRLFKTSLPCCWNVFFSPILIYLGSKRQVRIERNKPTLFPQIEDSFGGKLSRKSGVSSISNQIDISLHSGATLRYGPNHCIMLLCLHLNAYYYNYLSSHNYTIVAYS